MTEKKAAVDSNASISSDQTLDVEPNQSTSIIFKQEYEAQYFGFTPKSFSDGMYNAVIVFTADSLDAVQEYISAQFPKLVNGDSGKQLILDTVIKAIDKAFDKFESYVWANIFKIPSHVLLPEDRVHLKGKYTAEDELHLDQELEDLKQKILEAKYKNMVLKKEWDQFQNVHKMYEQFLDLQKKMEKTCFHLGVSDMKESIIFNNTKAQKINSMLQTVKSLTVLEKVSTTKRTKEMEDEMDYPTVSKKMKKYN